MDVIPALCWLPTPRQLGARMPDSKNLERLLGMVREALAEADRQNNTLIAALLAECEEALRRSRLDP